MFRRYYSTFRGKIDSRLVTTFQHGANTLYMEDTSNRGKNSKLRKDHRQKVADNYYHTTGAMLSVATEKK